MPFDPSGNFTRSYNWQQDRDNGIHILAQRMDGEFDNFATGMNVVFFRNGTIPMTGNINLGTNYITGLGAGSAASPSERFADDPTSGMYLIAPGRVGMASAGTTAAEFNQWGMSTTFGRFTGSLTPTTGVGVEIGYDGTSGTVGAYDRSGVAFKPMRLYGTTVALQSSGSTVLLVSAGATAITGTLGVSGAVTVGGLLTSSAGMSATSISVSTAIAVGTTIVAGGNISTTDGSGLAQLTPGGDIKAVRAGGATGALVLNASGTRYLINDGTNYQLANQGLVVGGPIIANGYIYTNPSGSQGAAVLTPGSSTLTGQIIFPNAAGVQQGYIGLAATNGPIIYGNNTGNGHAFTGGNVTADSIETTGIIHAGGYFVSDKAVLGTSGFAGPEKLRVFGSVGGNNVATFENTSPSGNLGGIVVSIGNSGNNTSSWHFQGVTQSVAIWYLRGDGSITYTSDRRIKKDFAPAEQNYFERFMKLDIQSWRYKNDDSNAPKHFGPIAQDVEKVFPDRVQIAQHEIEGQEGFYPLLIDGTGLFGPDLAQAFIELGRRYIALEQRVMELEASIT